MKIRKEYVIPVVLIIALSLYLMMRSTDRTNYQLPELPAIIKKDVSKIEIKRPDSSVLLIKMDDGWEISPQGYPVNETEAGYILETIDELRITALVSEAKDYRRYDLDEDKKITVRAWSGDVLNREFQVGKPASTYQHTFVRLPGDERVYHARGNFSGRLSQKMENFRDKNVLAFDQSEITRIEINREGQSTVWVRKEVPVPDITEKQDDSEVLPEKTEIIWEDKEGKAIERSNVIRLLNAGSRLTCENYIEGAEKGDLAGPIYSIIFAGAKEYRLLIFQKKDQDLKGYPAISSENNYPFIISDHKADDIMQVDSGGGK